jgi:hypothetical protein
MQHIGLVVPAMPNIGIADPQRHLASLTFTISGVLQFLQHIPFFSPGKLYTGYTPQGQCLLTRLIISSVLHWLQQRTNFSLAIPNDGITLRSHSHSLLRLFICCIGVLFEEELLQTKLTISSVLHWLQHRASFSLAIPNEGWTLRSHSHSLLRLILGLVLSGEARLGFTVSLTNLLCELVIFITIIYYY